jgi:pimeloyl-ACP methyl ester carboxylesterase
MTTQWVERMAVEIAGEGDAVVLLHGLGGTSNTWTPQMGLLSRGRTIRPDLPGAGRSPLPASLSIESIAETVLRMLQALGVEQCVLAGHSMGTIVCQQVALMEPRRVRALALCGPLLAPADQGREGLRARAKKARAEGMDGIADAIVQASTSSHTKQNNLAAVAFVRESILRQPPEGYAANCEALAATTPADVSRIACPTLLVTGEDDVVAPPSVARGMGERIKGSRVHVLPRCGHWTTLEAAAEVNRLFKEFLSARH